MDCGLPLSLLYPALEQCHHSNHDWQHAISDIIDRVVTVTRVNFYNPKNLNKYPKRQFVKSKKYDLSLG
jgi:hypothetical protein